MKDKLKIYKTSRAFFEQIVPVDMHDFPHVAIQPNWPTGKFWPDRRHELKAFCEKNTGYHIATQVRPGMVYNFYVEKACFYYLCYGNSNPNIIYFHESYFKELLHSDGMEFLEDQFPSKPNKIN